MELPTRTVTLEEHVVMPSLEATVRAKPFYSRMFKILPKAAERLFDSGDLRLADMDAARVTMQVLSETPGVGINDVAGCQGVNDEMAAVVRAHPDRFAGLATLPMAHPAEAAAELERAVTQLGLRGALVDGHLPDGRHYDGAQFRPVFAVAERLEVPIYIHPAPMPPDLIQQRYTGEFPESLTMGLATGAWGWHEDCGLHFMKLYAAGVFDRFPRLRIILGHLGEMVPFMLDRAHRLPFMNAGNLKRSLKEVWDENVWVTTSGMFSVNPLATVLRTTKVERIMYSIDYPFESIHEGWTYLQELAGSGMVTKEELDLIAFGNADRLLRLR
jgi:predicted TIM-barrel fold metal-dependent hydrolase